jgi:hypothetical protein
MDILTSIKRGSKGGSWPEMQKRRATWEGFRAACQTATRLKIGLALTPNANALAGALVPAEHRRLHIGPSTPGSSGPPCELAALSLLLVNQARDA